MANVTINSNSDDGDFGDWVFMWIVSHLSICLSISANIIWMCITNCRKKITHMKSGDDHRSEVVHTTKCVRTIATQTSYEIGYSTDLQRSCCSEKIYVTRTGEKWHINPACGHLRNHPAKQLEPCKHCVR